MDDSRKCGVASSMLQLCVSLADCWMPGELISCPGGEYVRCAVNTLFIWIMAAIGRMVFGYRRTYIEYYDLEFSRRRVVADEKKET